MAGRHNHLHGFATAIHEISGLEYLSDCAHPRYGEVTVTPQQYGGIFYPKVV
jgi:hypothetical protein